MAQSQGNNHQNGDSTSITRSTSIIICSATGFACFMEDIELYRNVRQNSANENAPAHRPSAGEPDAVESLELIALTATSSTAQARILMSSSILLESAAALSRPSFVETGPPQTPSPLGPDFWVALDSGSTSPDNADMLGSTYSGGLNSPAYDILTASIHENTPTSSSNAPEPRHERRDERGQEGRERRSTRNPQDHTLQYPRNAKRRATYCYNTRKIADSNVCSTARTSRAARNNSYRARRDAMKEFKDASQAIKNDSNAVYSLSGSSGRNTGSSQAAIGNIARRYPAPSSTVPMARQSSRATSTVIRETPREIIANRSADEIPRPKPPRSLEAISLPSISDHTSSANPLPASDSTDVVNQPDDAASAVPATSGDGPGISRSSPASTVILDLSDYSSMDEDIDYAALATMYEDITGTPGPYSPTYTDTDNVEYWDTETPASPDVISYSPANYNDYSTSYTSAPDLDIIVHSGNSTVHYASTGVIRPPMPSSTARPLPSVDPDSTIGSTPSNEDHASNASADAGDYSPF